MSSAPCNVDKNQSPDPTEVAPAAAAKSASPKHSLGKLHASLAGSVARASGSFKLGKAEAKEAKTIPATSTTASLPTATPESEAESRKHLISELVSEDVPANASADAAAASDEGLLKHRCAIARTYL